MNIFQQLQGIIGVVNTPFNRLGKVDPAALHAFVMHYLDWGVVGFLITAKAAEIDKLTHEERQLIARTVVQAVNGKVPVIGGASADSTDERMVITKMLIDEGCEGILISVPYQDKNSFKEEVLRIASLKPGFLMLQDWDFHGYGIPVDVIIDLFKTVPCFKCLKVEVVPAGIKYSEILIKTAGKLHVSGGWASTQMIEGLDRGVNAFMPTILPDIYGKIFRLYHLGKRQNAVKLFYELTPIIAFSHQHLDISIHFNKRLLCRQAIFPTSLVREPILPFDKFHQKVADELIEKAIWLSQNLEYFE